MDIFELKKNLNYLDYEALMMFIDSQTYLTDDILCKVDRASMSSSLETRVPFLDKNVVEMAWSLPSSMKIRNKDGKWILKQILNKYIPKEYTERPKMGFGIPLGDWLRDELKDWAEDLLDKKNLENEGYVNPDLVIKLWNEHQSKKRDWQSILWPILIFQSWKKEN
jgi:asparagine synthase (glutamine-hydrolysing)